MNNHIEISERLSGIICWELGLHVEHSHRRWCVRNPISYEQYGDFNSQTMETVGGIAIHIPEDRIKDFEFLVDNPSRLRELKLRSRYPAVQNAWEHYQLLVKLCGGDDDA